MKDFPTQGCHPSVEATFGWIDGPFAEARAGSDGIGRTSRWRPVGDTVRTPTRSSQLTASWGMKPPVYLHKD